MRTLPSSDPTLWDYIGYAAVVVVLESFPALALHKLQGDFRHYLVNSCNVD